MIYRLLPQSLHTTADAAIRFFRTNHGATGFEIEQAIDPNVSYVTTLKAKLHDHHTLCVEVRPSAAINPIAQFVIDCMTGCRPVFLYIAIPKGTTDSEFQKNQKDAKQCGIGIVEVDEDGGGSVLQTAVSLSLAGVRRIKPNDYPQKYRQSLANAESTFLNGNPSKGCSEVYDEIEAVSRRLAHKVAKRGIWAPGKFDIDKGAWAALLKSLMNGINYGLLKPICPDLTDILFAELIGLTSYRNDTGHRPKNSKALMARDKQLRTRYEDACDRFRKLTNAVKPLKV